MLLLIPGPVQQLEEQIVSKGLCLNKETGILKKKKKV